MSKTKLLYIQHFSGMGGAILSMYYIIEKLDRSRYQPEVLFLGGEGPGVDFYRDRNIPVHVRDDISWYAHAENARYRIFSRRPLRPIMDYLRIGPSANKIEAFVREHGFELVHLNTSLLTPAAIGAKRAGAKVVWHVREPLYKGNFGWRRAWLRGNLLRYADHIIAISEEDAARIGPNDKTTVIYNYVDFAKFDKDITRGGIRQEFGIEPGEFLVVNLGGVVHSKGADIYLRAAHILREQGLPIRFLLVGYAGDSNISKASWSQKIYRFLKRHFRNERDMGAYSLQLHRDLKLNDTFIFTGLRDDIPQILADADLLAWTAIVPHFARPIIEAGAMQKAVVATDFPNSREVVGDEESALLIPPHDPKLLAEAIQELYEKPDLRKKLALEGYRRAKINFNADINAERVFDIYNSLASAIVAFAK